MALLADTFSRFAAVGALVGATMLAGTASQAQDVSFEGETIEIMVNFAAGGGTDTAARLVAPFVAKLNTPLDGAPWAGIKTVDQRVKQLTKGLRGKATIRPVSSRWAWVEYELAQGGQPMGLAALEAWRAGGSFADWKRAIAEVDPNTRRPWARLAVAS